MCNEERPRYTLHYKMFHVKHFIFSILDPGLNLYLSVSRETLHYLVNLEWNQINIR